MVLNVKRMFKNVEYTWVLRIFVRGEMTKKLGDLREIFGVRKDGVGEDVFV